VSDLKKYPIHVCASEREVMREMISDQRGDIPHVWRQLTDEKSQDFGSGDTIYMSAFEQGFIVASVAKQRDRIPDIWKQLMDLILKFRKDAGIRTIDLGNNMVQFIDNEGVRITRQKYEWEI
jgi:hypothetical protein